jgi:exodeoxyribonuclease VII large subunit
MDELSFNLPAAETQPVFTVSRLNRVCRFLLNETFGSVWIEGEISNFTAASSGHIYFTLRDSEAQVRCAMFRPQARSLKTRPQNGDHVLLKAQVGLYEPRGDYQLIVESLEDAGDGVLAKAFEQLKQKLASQGLFDEAHKKPLPSLPRAVGVVTSPTGAAIRDILSVLRRRFPAIEVILYPAKVQGAEAPGEIVRAIQLANRLNQCGVLIVGRGGGSSEDLWSFNEESVARAIHASRLPVVSAVGHEIDFTISDFVADLRAPTPSAAAEAVSPDRTEWLDRLERLSSRLQQNFGHRLVQIRHQTRFLEKRLAQLHPAQRLQTQSQRLDEMESRLHRGLKQQMNRMDQRLARQSGRLLSTRLDQQLRWHVTRCGHYGQRLRAAMERQLEQSRHQFTHLSQELEAVSPLATLARGYSITTQAESSAIVMTPCGAPTGTRIRTRLAEGELISIVESVQVDQPPG